MSTQKLWNTKWKRLKRKCVKNLSILAEEEHFENIAKRSASHSFDIRYCNEEQQFACEDYDADSNDSYDECDHGIKNNRFNTEDNSVQSTVEVYFAHGNEQENPYEVDASNNNNDCYDDSDHTSQNDQFNAEDNSLQSTNGIHCAFWDEEGSIYEVDNVSNITNIHCTVSTSDAAHEQRANVGEITTFCEAANLDIQLAQDLRVWAVKRNVTHNALSELLAILRRHNHTNLPMRAETLLRTPRRTVLIRELEGGGQFWYHGILSGLLSILSTGMLETTSDIFEIDVFFDGFSPYNSIRHSLWPIAGCIADHKEVFIIGLWCGETKCPQKLDAYLEAFVKEVLELRNGFNIENKYYKLKIRNIIADAPARAWLKCVNQHGSKFACERCTIQGMWFGNRMTYLHHEEAPLRTNESIRQQIHKEYHKGVSPLITQLQLEPVTQFPLESFHLLYLGVMKRILSRLYCAKRSKYKLPGDVIVQLDEFSMFLRSFFPSDFARRPRKLSDWKYYKGTEFRRLLLYDGFLSFRFMNREVYNNFLLFACAVRILVDPVFVKHYIVDADKLLRLFIEHSSKLYGQTFVVYNVHHLIHIAADCLLHGHLENFSAFKFESFLGCMKNLLHAPGNTLPQVARRVIEKAAAFRHSYAKKKVLFEQHHNTGPTVNCQGKQYKKVRTANAYFHVQSGDGYCLTKANEVLKIENFIQCIEGNYLIGRKFKVKSDLFSYPFCSSLIDIYIVNTLGPLHRWCLDDIKNKVVLLPFPEKDAEGNRIISKHVAFPMAHSEPL